MKEQIILCEVLNQTELRNWLLFIIAVIGGYITIKTYINTLKQRRIDNTFKTIDFLRRHIGKNQIETFVVLFHANNELCGVKYNEFRLHDGRVDTIEYMFSEGGCGNGDIHNMIELFNLISPTLKKLETGIIWFEYGQIMSKIYDWTRYLENETTKEERSQPAFYSDFNKYMKHNSKKMLFAPIKYYTYAE
ncbi:MAG: hypothetical protein PHI48_09070 [Bacteroidales bacterium]|nr:hypothetical protein [Bacteroidales bacterium]MDD4822691.1 hypothetical protein [Bacteroidales bacterium]